MSSEEGTLTEPHVDGGGDTFMVGVSLKLAVFPRDGVAQAQVKRRERDIREDCIAKVPEE